MKNCCEVVRGAVIRHTAVERAILAIAGTPCRCDRSFGSEVEAHKRNMTRLNGRGPWRTQPPVDPIASRVPGWVLSQERELAEDARRMVWRRCGGARDWRAVVVSLHCPRNLRARRQSLESVAEAAIASALRTGAWEAIAMHGGTVCNSYGYSAWTDAVLAVAAPDGRCWAWKDQIPANKATRSGIARATLPAAAPIFDKRCGGDSCALAWAEVRKVCEWISQRLDRLGRPMVRNQGG